MAVQNIDPRSEGLRNERDTVLSEAQPAAPSEALFGRLAPFGRVVELARDVHTASTAVAAAIASDTQRHGLLVGWIQDRSESLFAPDLEGIDLDSLVIIDVGRSEHQRDRANNGNGATGARDRSSFRPGSARRARPHANAGRAAELLLRSGAFGCVVIELVAEMIPVAMQNRLAALAREHEARVVVLRASDLSRDAMGPMVAVRAAPHRVFASPPLEPARIPLRTVPLRLFIARDEEVHRSSIHVELEITRDKTGGAPQGWQLDLALPPAMRPRKAGPCAAGELEEDCSAVAGPAIAGPSVDEDESRPGVQRGRASPHEDRVSA